MASPVKVNDLVKIDGQLVGRVVNIIRPLNTFNVYVVRTAQGEKQVPRYRLKVLPETVSLVPPPNLPIGDYSDLSQELINELFREDENDVDLGLDANFDTNDEVWNKEIDDFLTKNENENTAKKTKYDLKTVSFYFQNVLQEHRSLEKIPPLELNQLLCKFFMDAKKANGDEYEPSSLRGFRSSLDRHLKRLKYQKSILLDPEFARSREVFTCKLKHVKAEGKGNLPKAAEAVSQSEINKLWEVGQLGEGCPDAILNTLWWNNTMFFGLRSVRPHRNMLWGDVSLRVDSEGQEYLEYCERQTKTRTGANPNDTRRIPPRVWAVPSDPARCPVALYKKYRSLRPQNFSSNDHPFYLASHTKGVPRDGESWFKRQPVGKNKLGNIMKSMAQHAHLSSDKRLTNHSARKTMLQTLSEHNFAPTHIMQLSGHKNVASVNSYAKVSNTQHQKMSGTLVSRSLPLSAASTCPLAQNVCSTATAMPPVVSHLEVDNTSHSQNTIGLKSSSFEVVGSVFSGPIYGGVFNINIESRQVGIPGRDEPMSSAKRRRIIYSDSSSDEE